MITELQRKLHIIQHALGRDQYGALPRNIKIEYRNHYVIGPECDSYEDCASFVRENLMICLPRNDLLAGEMDIFQVTDAGREFMMVNSPKPEKISRSRQRAKHTYQRYLDITDAVSMTFLEFIQMESRDRRRVTK